MNPSADETGAVALRPPDQVMRLERMGAAFQTRLSFMRQLIRRMRRENWRFERLRFDVDADGYGTSVYTVHGPARSYSLVAFTADIRPDQRTDRVIAEAWDGTFSLFDGIPEDTDIERLRGNTPKQESGRFLASELTLARANKSMRLFEHVAGRLADGRQPDVALLAEVGYLMRTTAVYGSGKFGCADRLKIADRPELQAPFQAELLTVYLIRWMTIDLVNHVARGRGGERAVPLAPELARYLGIGNATGLGMAPFLIKYPNLINNWVVARETALARVRGQSDASASRIGEFRALLDRAARYVEEWNVEDETQTSRIAHLREDLRNLGEWSETGLDQPFPWDALYRYAERTCSVEGQEFAVSVLLEHHGDLIDELGASMSSGAVAMLQPAMPLGELVRLIDANYGWATDADYTSPSAQPRFWYYSEDKLEPRLGERYAEPGAEFEMPLAVGRDVSRLKADLLRHDSDETVADFLLVQPEHRHTARRVQSFSNQPYGEIRDNLLSAESRPIDVLRFKLAFFGVSKFDPKSDLWTRVNMYQGAPLPDDLAGTPGQEWVFPVRPVEGHVEHS